MAVRLARPVLGLGYVYNFCRVGTGNKGCFICVGCTGRKAGDNVDVFGSYSDYIEILVCVATVEDTTLTE